MTIDRIIRPRTFAHVVYKTRRFEAMLAWYQTVFGATVQHQTPVVAFLTYDDEHHRFAFVNLDVLEPRAAAPGQAPGPADRIDHLAYGFASLRDLCEKYRQLKGLGILPYWCVHHGVTISMYYADPDGNRMEFQIDCFASNDEANDFLKGPKFELNPIGVEFDPDDLLARLQAGESEASFHPRRVDLPVSPLRQPARP